MSMRGARGVPGVGDHPYVCKTEDLLAFLIFLTDECEICRLSSYCLTLRLKEPKDMTVFYSTSILKTRRAECYMLYETLGNHTEKMPRFPRENLAAHIGRVP